jgi:general secretion pathway protein A
MTPAKAKTELTGEPATGTTTLLRAALRSERCRDVRCRIIANPALTRPEFVAMLAQVFGLSAEAAASKAVLLHELERDLTGRRHGGEIDALVIDEAHVLSTELLEEVRLLSNLESDGRKLLPIVLAGQSELGARLDQPALRQMKQRVALRCEIGPFSLQETAGYIAARIWAAGGRPESLFTQDAVRTIHDASRGIARTINVIADNALVTAMALDRHTVDADTVRDVCEDFGVRVKEPLAVVRRPAAASGPVIAPPPDAAPTAASQQADTPRTRFGDSLRLRLFNSATR